MTKFQIPRVLKLLATALLITSSPLRAEEAGEAASLLIRNATLVDPAGKVADRVVSMLIRAGRLEIVTEDPVPTVEAREALDAEEG